MKFGVQLYTLRRYMKSEDNFPKVFSKIKAMGAETIQISGIGDFDSKEMGKLSKQFAMSVCATHSPFIRIKNDLDRLAEEHKEFNCSIIGLSTMPSDYSRKSLSDIEKFTDFLNQTAEKLKQYDLSIAYHNHSFEFKQAGGRIIYDYLIENTLPCVQFIPDTFWIKESGHEPVEYLKKLNGRINVIHLKDYKKRGKLTLMKELGGGELDFPSILEQAAASGAENAVIELDIAANPYKKLRKSFHYLESIK